MTADIEGLRKMKKEVYDRQYSEESVEVDPHQMFLSIEAAVQSCCGGSVPESCCKRACTREIKKTMSICRSSCGEDESSSGSLLHRMLDPPRVQSDVQEKSQVSVKSSRCSEIEGARLP